MAFQQQIGIKKKIIIIYFQSKSSCDEEEDLEEDTSQIVTENKNPKKKKSKRCPRYTQGNQSIIEIFLFAKHKNHYQKQYFREIFNLEDKIAEKRTNCSENDYSLKEVEEDMNLATMISKKNQKQQFIIQGKRFFILSFNSNSP